MKARHVISGLAAAWLVGLASVSDVRTQTLQHADHAAGASHGTVRGPLPEAVRRATERFRNVNRAIAEGYVQFQGCVSGPEEGAMGVHYSNFALFDGVIDVEHPEALVYEPRNGRLHLVAAEYITPAPAWDPGHGPFDKPHLLGNLLHFAPGPNRYGPDAFYELHVWAWKTNPRGPFTDWNSDVTCTQWEGGPF